MKKNNRTLIIIGGGSASGKSTVANKIAQRCPDKKVVFMNMDNYYKDLSHLDLEKRKKLNFDHPDAFNYKLLIASIKKLLSGKAIQEPIYDFKINSPSTHTKHIEPGDVIILDGILALENEELRKLAAIKIYIDTDSDLRLARRITRDVLERGRTLESVLDKYINTVKPMHEAFVEPSKRHADLILPSHSHNDVAIDIIVIKIISLIK